MSDEGFEQHPEVDVEGEGEALKQHIKVEYPEGLLGDIARHIQVFGIPPTLAALRLGIPRPLFERAMREGELSALVSNIFRLRDENILSEEEVVDYLSDQALTVEDKDKVIKPHLEEGWRAIQKASGIRLETLFAAANNGDVACNMFQTLGALFSPLCLEKHGDNTLNSLLRTSGADEGASEMATDALRDIVKRTIETQEDKTPTPDDALEALKAAENEA